jgi:hypothetical protein
MDSRQREGDPLYGIGRGIRRVIMDNSRDIRPDAIDRQVDMNFLGWDSLSLQRMTLIIYENQIREPAICKADPCGFGHKKVWVDSYTDIAPCTGLKTKPKGPSSRPQEGFGSG